MSKDRATACVAACSSIPTYQLTAEDGMPTDLWLTIESLRQQLAAAKEEITLDEQRVADLMSQVGELSAQLSSRDAEIIDLVDNNNELAVRISELRGKLDEARNALIENTYSNSTEISKKLAREALAATEPPK